MGLVSGFKEGLHIIYFASCHQRVRALLVETLSCSPISLQIHFYRKKNLKSLFWHARLLMS